MDARNHIPSRDMEAGSQIHESNSGLSVRQFQRVIMGVDPGTNVMGYGILGIDGRRPRAVAMGVIRLSKYEDHYMRLRRIFERVTSLIDQYVPDELAIEAPFFGKNVQSMLKLGRAQGVAMAAALERDLTITEYEPRKIKQAITGNGAASKEQVQEMLRRILDIPAEQLLPELDATDALAAALCHFYETAKAAAMPAAPQGSAGGAVIPKSTRGSSSWAAFVAANPSRVKK